MWSNERNNAALKNAVTMHILCKVVSPMLATTPGSNEVYTNFIASKAPDAKTRQQEIEMLGTEEVERLATTRFIRAKMFQDPVNPWKFYDPVDIMNKPPYGAKEDIYNVFMGYCVGGFFKERIAMLQRASDKTAKATGKKVTKKEAEEEEMVKDMASDFKSHTGKKTFACSGIRAFKKVVDGSIKSLDWKIPLIFPETFVHDENGVIPGLNPEDGLPWVCQRSLRAQTAQGERTALASSEFAPPGTMYALNIITTDPSLVPAMKECLDFGQYVGMLQNRGNGFGRFVWTPISPDTGEMVDD